VRALSVYICATGNPFRVRAKTRWDVVKMNLLKTFYFFQIYIFFFKFESNIMNRIGFDKN